MTKTLVIPAKAGIHAGLFVALCLINSACGNDDDSETDTTPDEYNSECTAFVDGEVEESGDGWLWESAVKTVQEGIDLAHYGATDVGICEQWEVWVKQGTYYIYQDSRENTVLLKEQVALLGGFNGTETAEYERDWEANVTTLNGRDGPDGENHVYNVVTGSDYSTLDGFTVTGGRADEDVFDSIYGRGGGMISWNASPTITHCVFEDNHALMSGGGIDIFDGTVVISDSTFSSNSSTSGGAIAVFDSSVELTDVDFIDNSVQGNEFDVPNTDRGFGGGIHVEGADAVITRCEFIGNTSYDWFGGGINASFMSNVEISNTLFETNRADSGAGIMAWNGCSVDVTDSTFRGNDADTEGGGLEVYESVVAISACTFEGNTAHDWVGGGILISGASDVDIDNTLFEGNVALAGGGVIIFGGASLDVTDSTFRGNHADTDGGGLSVVQSTAVISECTFEDNTAPLGGGSINCLGSSTYTNCVFAGNGTSKTTGGGICSEGGSTQATNCTFYDNTAASGAALHSTSYLGTEDDTTIVNSIAWNNSPVVIEWDTVSPTVTFSDVEGGFKGDGNIDLDPLFVDSANGDFHLQSGSPCIDAASTEDAPVTDFDGNSRDDEPDMGAYEYQ